jgi:hypothetical protein
VKRVPLILLILTAAIALLALLRLAHQPHPKGCEPPPEIPEFHGTAAESVQLSYVELADSPHRSEFAGQTQVYGWLLRADDGSRVSGGTLRLRVVDYSSSEESAAVEYERALAKASLPHGIDLSARVQEDGGWYVDLLGKAWIDSAEYTPDPKAAGLPPLARTGVGIAWPLERGALELSFRVDLALDARGIVVDALGAPVAGARVRPRGLGVLASSSPSAEDGGFLLTGIVPQELIAEHGLIQFEVQAEGYETTRRLIAWEPGQSTLPPFRVVLNSLVR